MVFESPPPPPYPLLLFHFIRLFLQHCLHGTQGFADSKVQGEDESRTGIDNAWRADETRKRTRMAVIDLQRVYRYKTFADLHTNRDHQSDNQPHDDDHQHRQILLKLFPPDPATQIAIAAVVVNAIVIVIATLLVMMIRA